MFSPKDMLYKQVAVIINFMCQFDWAMGYPDIWSNTKLSVSARACLDEIIIKSVDVE